MAAREKTGRDLKRSPADVLRITVIAVAAAALVVGTGAVLVLRGSERTVVAGPRTDAERADLLASGQCAVRPDGRLLGRIVGEHGPTRGFPQGGYVIETIDVRGEMDVPQEEVRIVSCASIHR